MREQFEKLPEVAKRLDGIYWNAELNIYQTEYPILFNAVGFVNGALYAYKEQQKKIDAQSKTVMGQEYDSLKGMGEFFDALQEKLESRPIDQT